MNDQIIGINQTEYHVEVAGFIQLPDPGHGQGITRADEDEAVIRAIATGRLTVYIRRADLWRQEQKQNEPDRLSEREDRVREEVREWAKDNPDADDSDFSDAAHEIADGATPSYNAALLEIAADNVGMALTEPEIGPAFDGRPTPVNIIAANVYERLSAVAYEEWETIKAERDEQEAEG